MRAYSESVSMAVADGLATVRLAREHGNAINGDMLEGLRAAFLEAAGEPSIRGVLLAASGKMFCPGLDLQEMIDFDRSELLEFMGRFSSTMQTLYALPKPLVAAVGGHALAGGCLMALTADRRLLRRGAMVGLNEIRVGVPLPFGMALILRESVPSSRLEEVALLGRNYTDEDAVRAGIVHEVLPEDGFERTCRERLEEMAAKDPLAFATTKRYLRAATVGWIRDHDERLRPEFLDCWFSEGTRKRMEKIVEDLRKSKDGKEREAREER